jgi:hypothetical protein
VNPKFHSTSYFPPVGTLQEVQQFVWIPQLTHPSFLLKAVFIEELQEKWALLPAERVKKFCTYLHTKQTYIHMTRCEENHVCVCLSFVCGSSWFFNH